MKELYRGAESVIYLDSFDGQKAIVKERLEKKYRVKELDEKLRKERTRKEVKLLTEARKIGIPTPRILAVDEEKSIIVMESISGEMIKNILFSNEESAKNVCYEIGRSVGKLHHHNIIHGDLTTSNMILKDNQIYFIDFSLGGESSRDEDKGVDLKLFQEVLNSTHFKVADECWGGFAEGYKKEYFNAEHILKKVKEIKRRVRYAERGE